MTNMICLVLSLLLLAFATTATADTTHDINETPTSPIILVPGDGGSALEMRINGTKSSVPHFFCERTTRGRWKRVWFSPSVLSPGYVDCWADNIRLRYTSKVDGTSSVSNAPGVEIQAVKGKDGLTVLKGVSSSNVYKALLDRFGDSIDAKPYDFRLSPTGNPAFVTDLKRMVEDTYERTGGARKVTLVSHSLGCLMVHSFFIKTVDTAWRDKYIHAWIPISPAIGGAPYDLLQIITGDPTSFKWVNPKDLRDEQRSFESSLWLMPDPHLYPNSVRTNNHYDDGFDGVIVQSRLFNYTTSDYNRLFADIGFSDGPIVYDRVKNLTEWADSDRAELQDPGVAVYPIYGNNQETTIKFIYGDVKKGPIDKVTTMNGDNTVPRRSLETCNGFARSFSPLVVDGKGHLDVLTDETVLDHIQAIVESEAVET